MDFLTNIRNQVNAFETTNDKYSISDTVVNKNEPQLKSTSSIRPESNISSLDFFLSELENRNFFNNKLKEQERLRELDEIKTSLVTKLKELHIENKLNPAFIKELISAIEFTYNKFREDQNLKPDNFYQVCLAYIDSRRPTVSDYNQSHVNF